MTNDWIIDVLADLKNFAQTNGLLALAEQLDDTRLVAAAELASCQGQDKEVATGDGRATRDTHGTYQSGGNA